MNIKGQLGPIDQGIEQSWDKSNGHRSVHVWTGTLADVQGLVPQVEASFYTGWRYNRIGSSPMFRFEADIPTDETSGEEQAPVDTHELLGNQLQQALVDNPVLNTTLTAAEIAWVVAVVRLYHTKPEEYGPDITAARAGAIANINELTTPGTALGAALELFDDLDKGSDTFVTSQYVYRRTRTVGTTSTLQAVFTNVMRIFQTSAAVIAAEEIPGDLNSTLPPGEWLKQTPTVTAALGQRTQIVYEYWHADIWSRIRYELAT